MKPIGFHRRKPHLLSGAIAVFLLAIIAQLTAITPSALLSSSDERLDLSGDWEYCTFPEVLGSRPPSACAWQQVMVPSSIPQSALKSDKGWVLYRKSFDSPRFCRENGQLCSVVFGEVGDAVQATLNGRVIGRHGGFPPDSRYAKHYPPRFDLSPDILRSGTNTLQILVYHFKKAQTGIRKGPVAIVPANNAFRVTEAITIQAVIVPLLAAAGVILFGILSGMSLLLNKIRSARLVKYTLYCFSSAFFLISFTNLPREVLPISLAGCLHFMSRFLMDWALIELVFETFDLGMGLRKMMRAIYAVIVAIFGIQFIAYPLVPSILQPFTGFDGAVLISQYALPFVLAPYYLGAASAFTERRREGLGLTVAFGILAALQTADSLAFHGLHTLPYFVKFYPFFAVLIFGIYLWSEQLFNHEELKAKAWLADVAAEAAHNIRSPLAILNSLVGQTRGLDEDRRTTLRNVSNSIRDIANELEYNYKLTNRLETPYLEKRAIQEPGALESKSVELISSLVEAQVSDQRYQYRNSKISILYDVDCSAYGLFSDLNAAQFKSVLSNLINNGAEAIEKSGQVVLNVSRIGESARIEVIDDGAGIDVIYLSQIFKKGFTFGKTSGTGLGLFHAKKCIESWGGTIVAESRVGFGSKFIISLPLATVPKWFLPAILLNPGTHIIALDDGSAVHQLWDSRFSGGDHEIVHFSNGEEFLNWVRGNPILTKSSLFLMDYHLFNQSRNGLELIDELEIQDNAILVTSRFEDRELRYECEIRGMKLLPKGLAGFVPISERSSRPGLRVKPHKGNEKSMESYNVKSK